MKCFITQEKKDIFEVVFQRYSGAAASKMVEMKENNYQLGREKKKICYKENQDGSQKGVNMDVKVIWRFVIYVIYVE